MNELDQLATAMRADVLHAIAELKTQMVWYVLAFSVAQVALIVGLLRGLR